MKRAQVLNHDTQFWPIAVFREGMQTTDSVEKVDLLPGLGQNLSIGQREDSPHDGTIVEWTGTAVLLVQP